MINNFNKTYLIFCCFGIFASVNDTVDNTYNNSNYSSQCNNRGISSYSSAGYSDWNQISADYIDRDDEQVLNEQGFIPANTNVEANSNKGNGILPTDHDEFCVSDC